MSLYINSFQVIFRLIIFWTSQQTYKEMRGIGKGSFKSQKLEKGTLGNKEIEGVHIADKDHPEQVLSPVVF